MQVNRMTKWNHGGTQNKKKVYAFTETSNTYLSGKRRINR